MTQEPELRREEGIKRLGVKMLQGWVLTDVPCAQCRIPTMRKKDRSVVHHCVLCQDSENPWPLAAGNEGLLGRGSFDSAGPELPVEEEFALADSDKLALDELMAGDDQAPPATKATPSSLLGEKLLQG
ncbi:hypothetical protein HDU91_007334, partial [Kappamyces sp. JEL0680]